MFAFLCAGGILGARPRATKEPGDSDLNQRGVPRSGPKEGGGQYANEAGFARETLSARFAGLLEAQASIPRFLRHPGPHAFTRFAGCWRLRGVETRRQVRIPTIPSSCSEGRLKIINRMIQTVQPYDDRRSVETMRRSNSPVYLMRGQTTCG